MFRNRPPQAKKINPAPPLPLTIQAKNYKKQLAAGENF
jgi:hypothetical protein